MTAIHPEPVNDRAPQRSIETDTGEKILTCILTHPGHVAEVPDLEIDDFVDFRHRAIWEVIRNLEHRNEPIGFMSIEADLYEMDMTRDGRLQEHACRGYLEALITGENPPRA